MEAPKCPNCGAEMELKTARRGANTGSQFWSCPNWRQSTECKRQTLSYDEGRRPSGGVTEPQELSGILEGLSEPRAIAARPFHKGMDTLYFDFLTVPLRDLEATSEAYGHSLPLLGTHWRMSYLRPEAGALEIAAARALSIADKVICRGHVCLLPEPLEKTLDRRTTSAMGQSRLHNDPMLDSDEESLFWGNVLPRVLGPSFRTWCTPQVELFSLTGSTELDGSEQRVDFLITHPQLDSPMVVEIDGQQHSTHFDADVTRDARLQACGYRVVRIPAHELRQGSGPALDSLAETLSQLDQATRFEGNLSSPIRRAGQVQAALLTAIQVGLVPVSGFGVSCDLVMAGELTEREFRAVVDDLSDLLRRLGKMYDEPALEEGIRVCSPESADIVLTFFGGAPGERVVLIEDACFPFSIKWPARPTEPGCPVRFDRDSIRYFLRRIFRKAEFRDGQYDIVSRALLAKDTVALLPTGAGKSIAFQLAAMLLPGRTVVVAPIISLIRDQISNLRDYGIDRALGISSDLAGREERNRAYDLLKLGEAFFYYVAPERFQMPEFREKLRGMTAAFPVNMIVIDEAHCVSEWGHDFRTAYLRIGQTSRECAKSGSWVPPLIALTGTASRAVLRDLQRELQITDFEAIVTPATFDRQELRFGVLRERSDHKKRVLEGYLLNKLPAAFGLPREAFFGRDGRSTHCGLVFCLNVNGPFGVEEISRTLMEAGIKAGSYSGTKPRSFPGSDRDWNEIKRLTERRFKRDEYSVLVATKAFGMGIDKPNIRFTVHFGIPASIEAFYQEAGRAGRDGKPAACTLIVSDDRTEKNRQLLAPATAIREVADFVRETPWGENDDVSRALYFHVESFQGIDEENTVVAEVLAFLRPTGERAVRGVPFGRTREITEKALHRLVVVGVVEDYTIDYSARAFSATLARTNRKASVEKYCAYVSAYQKGRAEQERRKADALSPDWDAFVIGLVSLYIQFVYDVIERGRRRAIAEMLAACQAGSGEDLRRRILDYLEQGEFSEAIEEVLSDSRAGLGKIEGVLGGLVSPNDAAQLRGQVARQLETYPDHPGLLLLRTATEALTRDSDPRTIQENYEAFLLNAVDAYGMDAEEIATATGTVLKFVGRANRNSGRLIEQLFVLKIRDRESLKGLIAQAGIGVLQLSPWVLLDDDSQPVERFIR